MIRPALVVPPSANVRDGISRCHVTVDSELDGHMLQRTAVARQGCRQGLKKEVVADIEAGKFVSGSGPYDRRGKTISVSCRRVRIRAACARCQDAPQRRRRWLFRRSILHGAGLSAQDSHVAVWRDGAVASAGQHDVAIRRHVPAAREIREHDWFM